MVGNNKHTGGATLQSLEKAGFLPPIKIVNILLFTIPFFMCHDTALLNVSLFCY